MAQCYPPAWCKLVKCLMKHVGKYVVTLGPFGLGKLREGISIWFSLLKSEAKVKYLNLRQLENMVPLHFLNHLIKLENCFNNTFLRFYKFNNVFSGIGNKLIRLDIKQATPNQ